MKDSTKIGRPSDEYPREDFIRFLTAEMEKRGWKKSGKLARAAGVNRASLKHVLEAGRACSRKDRVALLKALDAAPELYVQFNCAAEIPTPEWQPHELDYCDGFAPWSALRSMEQERGSPLHEACVQAFRAWQRQQSLDFDTAILESRKGLKQVADLIGVSFPKFIETPTSFGGELAPGVSVKDACILISLMLYIHASILIRRAAYDSTWVGGAGKAKQILGDLSRVHAVVADQDPPNSRRQFGHLLRLQGLLTAIEILPEDHSAKKDFTLQQERALRLFSESKEYFGAGSRDEALVIRDHGVALWQFGKPGNAEYHLRKALSRFLSLRDQSESALALAALSDVALARLDRSNAIGYAVTAAVLSSGPFTVEQARQRISGLRVREVQDYANQAKHLLERYFPLTEGTEWFADILTRLSIADLLEPWRENTDNREYILRWDEDFKRAS